MTQETLSPDETRRYARQLVLKGFGGVAQQKLKAARVAVVGAGALGSPVLAYLAAAGVGTLCIIDHDSVALSNLQRQIVHTTAAIGAEKAASAAGFIAALNPHVRVVQHAVRLTPDNAETLLAGNDLVVDGSDTFSTRLVVARSAQALGLPLVSGAVSMFDGHVTSIVPGLDNPRFADLFPDVPDDADLPNCEAVGVLGATTGVIGSLMASEAIKLITGTGEPMVGRLLIYDGRAARFTEMTYRRT